MDIKDTPEFNTYSIDIAVDTGTPSPENPQANTPAVVPENTNIQNSANGSVVGSGTVQSPNFAPGASGWRLDSNGNLEANDGKFRGDITGASGTFSGTLTAPTIKYGKTSLADSTNAGFWISLDGFYVGSAADTAKLKYVTATGAFEIGGLKITSLAVGSSLDGQYLTSLSVTAASIANATITGTQIALATIAAGNIANATITATQIAALTIAAGNIANNTITAIQIANNTITASQIANNTVTASQIANATITSSQISGTAGITGAQIASATIAGANIANNAVTATQIANNTVTAGQIASLTITASQIANLTIVSGKVNTALMSYNHNIVFSVNGAALSTTVDWASGTLTTSDGTSYSISAGNTGVMAAKTFVYLDTAVSTTVLQTTATLGTAVGDGKMLIAVAQNNTTECIFQVFNGIGGTNLAGSSIVANSITASEIAANTITATQIAANTITATQIAAGTITATQMTVSQLSAISADLGTITAGTITMPNTGYIKGGQTDYNTGTGFFLGYSGAAYKFSIGVATGDYLTWDGTNLTVSASKIVKLFTAGMAINAGEVVFMHTDGKVYSGDASYAGQTNKAFGICLTTTALNANAPIQTFGTASGLSSLTIASTYYLQNATHTIDQSFETSGDTRVTPSGELYQSFTAGVGVNNISKISLYLYNVSGSSGYNVTIKLRDGEGTGGTELATFTVFVALNFKDDWAVCTLNAPAPVVAGNKYSITMSGGSSNISWYEDIAGGYAGGRNDQNANYDYYFRAYTSTGRGALGTSAGTTSKIMGFATSATELQLNYTIT